MPVLAGCVPLRGPFFAAAGQGSSEVPAVAVSLDGERNLRWVVAVFEIQPVIFHGFKKSGKRVFFMEGGLRWGVRFRVVFEGFGKAVPS